MKVLIVAVMIAHLPGAVIADDVFDYGMIFPGPNPEAIDLLPEADPDEVFRIGKIIFDYSSQRHAKVDQPVSDLSELQSVADAVKAATPGPSLTALVEQQLTSPHEFHFESATVVDQGDTGLEWIVTYQLFLKEGGSSGVPFEYRAVLDGRGNLVAPRLAVFDAFFHSPEEGWTCSVLKLPTNPTAEDAALSAEKIRSRAAEALKNATAPSDATNAVRTRMEYQSQKLVRIPVATDANGKLSHTEIWAVNFRDPARTERSDEILTVWVAPDGRAAAIKHLAHE